MTTVANAKATKLMNETLVFYIVKDGKKVKTLKAQKMATIVKNFQKYCQTKGFESCVFSPASFGNTAYTNKTGNLMTLRQMY